MIRRATRGGVLAKRSDEDYDLFADHDEVVDDVVEPSAAEMPEHDAARKRTFTRLQFALAALSATPVLFIGGLGGWPWEKDAASANPEIVAGQAHYPVSVQLARLGIDTELDALNLDPTTDLLQIPDLGRAGWIESGPEPGEMGRSVILGRRSTDGADVFAKLTKARSGDKIVVTTEGGKALTFVVRSVEEFRAGAVPEARVYGGDKKSAQLRMVTSTGAYNQASGGFPRNVVVFADLAR